MDTKAWYASRTVWAGVLAIIAAVLAAVLDVPLVRDTPHVAESILAAAGVVGIVLRLVTGQPIAGSPADTPPAPVRR